MELYKIITLTQDEMQKCIAFSEESAKTQQQIENASESENQQLA